MAEAEPQVIVHEATALAGDFDVGAADFAVATGTCTWRYVVLR